MPDYTFSARKPKDPDAELDYSIDWTAWLNKVQDVIASSTWTVTEGAGTIIEGQCTFTDTLAIGRVSGGTAGSSMTIRNNITTVTGLKDDRSIRIKIREL